MAHTWDPDRYLTYADERGRPFVELVARVGAGARPRSSTSAAGRATSPGCSPSAGRTPTWSGLDSSPEMIETARALGQSVDYAVADLRDWRPERPVDVLVSNATLQWVPGHLELLPVAGRRGGAGRLVRLPGARATSTSRATRSGPSWPPRRRTPSTPRTSPTPSSHDPAVYYDALAALGCAVDVWETTYLHVLSGADPVFTWVSGTGARPDPAGAAGRPAADVRGGVQAPAGRGVPGPRRRHRAAAVPAGVRGGPGRVVRLHHVQVCCPRGGEDARAPVLRRGARADRGREAGRARRPGRRLVPGVRRRRRGHGGAARRRRGAVRAGPQGAPGAAAASTRGAGGGRGAAGAAGVRRGPQRVGHVPGVPQGARERRTTAIGSSFWPDLPGTSLEP